MELLLSASISASEASCEDMKAVDAMANYLDGAQGGGSLRVLIDLPAGSGNVKDGSIVFNMGGVSVCLCPVYAMDGDAIEAVLRDINEHGLSIKFGMQQPADGTEQPSDNAGQPPEACEGCTRESGYPNGCPGCCPAIDAGGSGHGCAAGGHPHYDPYPGGYHGGG